MKKLYLLTILIINTLATQAQFSEGFEAGVPPTGWAMFDNGEGVATTWASTGPSEANSGSDAAYIDFDCGVSATSEDWLVTPQITIATGDVLTFFHKDIDTDDYGSSYEIRISTTSQTNPASFTTLMAYTESMVPDTYQQQAIGLSAYDGMNVYIAFVQVQDCGDAWYIDDVNVGSVSSCFPVTNLMVTSTTTTTADLVWNPTSASMWDVSVVPLGQGPGSYSTVGTATFTTGTLPSGFYTAHVREVCSDSSPLMLTGVIDGPLTGGTPKAIELYAVGDIPDLSIFGVSSANNGGGTTTTPEFTFPSGSLAAGSYIYLATDSANFNNFMGFDADYIDGNAPNINGDDAIELYMNGTVVDVFGDVNVDGSGQPWEYLDGWVYRMDGTLNNGGLFNVADWNYSGINAQDGETTNAGSAIPWPNGTFTTSSDISTWSSVNFCLNVTGDNESDALAIPSLPYADTATTGGCYSDNYGEASADVFYRLVVDPCISEITVSLCDAFTNYDTYLSILDAQLNELDSNDDDCGLQSTIYDFSVAGYDTLYIVVEGFDTEVGNYVLNITSLYYDSLALISQTDVTCFSDPTGSATVDNGDPGFTFQWDDPNAQTGITATNLTAGTYVVTATNIAGCVYTDTVTITSSNPEITTNPLVTDVDCFGNANGSAVLNEGGGTGSLTVDWGGENPTALSGGTHVYTVTDGAGCVLEDSVIVNEPADITLSATSTDETFGNDGAIDLTVSGGTAPYSYTWTNGAGSNEDPTGLTGNMSYMVTVTDANGCSDTLTINVASVVGIDENGTILVRIYPNPNNGNFTLELPTTISASTAVQVYAASGQLVSEFTAKPGTSVVNLDHLVRGTYVMHVISDTASHQIRFTVM